MSRMVYTYELALADGTHAIVHTYHNFSEFSFCIQHNSYEDERGWTVPPQAVVKFKLVDERPE